MTKILILGGGFGGVRAALDLERKLGSKAEITLIDKNSYHLFVPALYEVASAYGVKKDPFAIRLKKTICVPYADIFKNKKVNFIQAEISSVDPENKKVVTRGGEILDYDYLVIALGSTTEYFDVIGAKEYAFKFKNLEDALLLNQKIDELIKEVATGQRAKPVKIAVVGAGFTGIEVAAEFACCVKKLSKACLPSVAFLASETLVKGVAKGGGIKGRCERIMLFEAGPKILPMVSENERDIVLKRLTHLGIEVIENATAEEIGNKYLKLKNGKQFDIDIAIWTAGIRPPELLEKIMPDSLTEKKKIKVNSSMEVIGLTGVFAIGDNTELIDLKIAKPIPALAYVAIDQGKIAAKNIVRSMEAKKLVNYDPFYGVWIAPIGGKYALAHLRWGINIKGFWGWIIRELIDSKYMLSILSFKKAVSILWQEMTLFTKND